jgi:hypothetical protein
LGELLFLPVVGGSSLALGACAWRYLRRPLASGSAGRFAQALGLLALASLAAAVVQFVASSLGWNWERTSFHPLGLVAMLPISWFVLCGGWSVQGLFEETAKSLSGHRRDTMIDNWSYYAALTGVQLVLLAALVAWRWRHAPKRDPLASSAAALAFANGLAGMAWPWWGS